MRALLDTNIIIHRENTKVSNQSIGLLYYWLDKLHYDKLIHPYSIKELRKYSNKQMQNLYDAKISSYIELKTIAHQNEQFLEKLISTSKSENDEVDNQLLCEVFCDRADILITEDRKMRGKANALGIENRVFSINAFIAKVTAENPELINYKALSVKKEYIGNIDVNDVFFESLKLSYSGFETWFASKSNEEAYVCRSDNRKILGFLYLKTEENLSDFQDIKPAFEAMRRLKIGTFKIESTGFRLGERFIKIIFDNAVERKVNEIYVTLFENRQELEALGDLLKRWGFYEYGIKESKSGQELVLVKKLGKYNYDFTIKENYPNINYNKSKMILPILPQYHTNLLPDSQIRTENEVDFIGQISYRYALQKVYITWGIKNNVCEGDILLFYRMGDKIPKKYSSVITTVGVIDEIKKDFLNKEQYMSYCQNRSVFSKEELEQFWDSHRYNLCIVKFIYIKSFVNKLTLGYLWDKGVVDPPGGPRPFHLLTEEQFEMLITDSKTALYNERG